jgi:hypothetical protein
MSQIFFDSRTREILWYPASTVAILFYNQIAALEVTYELDSGVIEGEFGDEYYVDVQQFRHFIEGLVKQLTHTHHPYEFLMVNGCLSMCFILHWQAVREWPVVPKEHQQLQVVLAEAQLIFSQHGLPV